MKSPKKHLKEITHDNDTWIEHVAILDDGKRKRSYFSSQKTGELIWDEPPSGASNIILTVDRKKETTSLTNGALITSNELHSEANRLLLFPDICTDKKYRNHKEIPLRRVLSSFQENRPNINPPFGYELLGPKEPCLGAKEVKDCLRRSKRNNPSL